MSRIQQLDASVINKIAAGEVIERPANVVKELLENSIDALATRVEVDIVEGGAELIRITDDGQGIHPDDVLLTVASHATSKIRSAEDLFYVQTMGFRGEALASIAEVSQFRFRSRQHDALAGVDLNVSCGEISPPEPCGCPPGTTIEIRDLFSSTPVRRKFLRAKSTEFGHINEQFTRIALANPRLHMVLRHNNKLVLDLPPAAQLIDRLRLFFGDSLAEQLIYVESEFEDVRFSGYVAHPSLSKSSRKWQHFFLNGRWFQDRSLQHALTEAYRGILMVGRQPIAFLFVDMPPSSFDINVHPTKIEVRFVDSQQLYRQLLSMLRTKFLGIDLDSQMKLGSRRKDDDSSADEPTGSGSPKELQAELNDWAGAGSQTTSPATSSDASRGYLGDSPPVTTWSLGSARREAALLAEPDPENAPTGDMCAEHAAHDDDTHADVTDLPETESAAETLFVGRESSPVTPDDETEDMSSSELVGLLRKAGAAGFDAADVPETSSAKPQPGVGEQSGLRAMQIMDCYLVAETDQGMLIVDQHALHERIMYEYLRPRVLENSVESQRLLIPESIELNAREAALIIEHADVLGQLGIGVEEFGANTVLVNAWPVMLQKARPADLMRDIVEQLESDDKKPTRRDVLDSLLHMTSCKAAIKAGQRLTPEEIDSLLAQRHLIDDAHHCPHGRPTALLLSQAELDRRFGRLG
jgi:DNA mismatch repair protein MutL